MSDTTRTVLIALGVALLVIVLVPLLFMGGMMGMMGGMMGGGLTGGQCCGGAGPWLMVGLVALVLLAAVALLVVGLRRPGAPGGQS